MAAIRRARQDFVCKLDPEGSPDAQVNVGSSIMASPGASEQRTRRTWRSLGMVVSLSIVGLVGLPANWLVDGGGGQAPWQTEHARIVETGGAAFAAMPLLPALPVALQAVSLPSVTPLASAPRVNTPARERVSMPSHAKRNTARTAQPLPATRVATARPNKPVVRGAQQQLASGDTSSTSHSAQPVAAAAVSVPAAPLAVTRPIRAAALGDALAPCARESVFARTWCEHQARLRYCDGRRGSPECTTSTNEDHGG